LAAEVKNTCGLEAELIQSSGGVFEIEIGGKLIFSKAALERFPEDGEIVRLLSNGQ